MFSARVRARAYLNQLVNGFVKRFVNSGSLIRLPLSALPPAPNPPPAQVAPATRATKALCESTPRSRNPDNVLRRYLGQGWRHAPDFFRTLLARRQVTTGSYLLRLRS